MTFRGGKATFISCFLPLQLLIRGGNFIACHHLYSAIYYIYLVEDGMTYIIIHVHSIGIAAYLRLGLFHGCIYFRLRRITLQILQLDDI